MTRGDSTDRLDALLAESVDAFAMACHHAKLIAEGNPEADESSRAWKKDAQKLLVRAKALARARARRRRSSSVT